MVGAVRLAGGKSSAGEREALPEREYERHRGAVLGMLAKRFPRFDEEERLGLYHDAWARVLAKRARGETIDSLRAYLLATAGAEAMNAATRRRAPLPVGPDDPLLGSLADNSLAVEDEVMVRDEARLARELIDSLDERQRDVLKLRWDIGMSASEVRAALGLSSRQYQRLAEEGAAAIAERVAQLEDGTWSRQQRSLLAACLVRVTCEGEVREGIATSSQRSRAQRLLESDPHVAALYAELRAATRRAAALLPVPAFVTAEPSIAAPLAELATAARDRATDLVASLKHTTTSIYVRAADPSLLTAPGPGATAIAASTLAIGVGAYGTHKQLDRDPPRNASSGLAVEGAQAEAGGRAVVAPRQALSFREEAKVDRRDSRRRVRRARTSPLPESSSAESSPVADLPHSPGLSSSDSVPTEFGFEN
jgi:RNA polymerase sigma factor (sigma-70 family)